MAIRRDDLFKRLTQLFSGGPTIKKKVRAFRQPSASTAADVFKKSYSQIYSNAINAYGQYDRMSRYADFCFHPDTEIYLADGSTKTIKEIVSLWDAGHRNILAMSCDFSLSEFRYETKPIIMAAMTRKDAVVMRVVLSDGSGVTVTPDHKWYRGDGSRCMTSDLRTGDDIATGTWGATYHESRRLIVSSVETLSDKIDTFNVTVEKNHNVFVKLGQGTHDFSSIKSAADEAPTAYKPLDFLIIAQSEMEYTPEISSAIDIYAEEACGNDENGNVLHIYSDNSKIFQLLTELLHGTLNVDHNIIPWTRNLPVRKNTLIPLLDGRNITIEDLAREFSEGKENWVYSVQDETQRTVPGKVSWCGLTRKDEKLQRTWLDDGSYIDTTLDHEFVMRNGTRKRADKLCENDSLMPFYRQSSSSERGALMDGYEQVYDPATNRYVYTHRRIAEILPECKLNNGRWIVTHHIDFNKNNNDPKNLIRMDELEHLKLHNEHATALFSRPDVAKARREGLEQYWGSDKHKDVSRRKLARRQANGEMLGWSGYNSSPQFVTDNAKRSASMQALWADDTQRSIRRQKLTISFDEKCVELLLAKLKQNKKYVSLSILGKQLKDDAVFIKHFKSINEKSKRDVTKALNSDCGIKALLSRLDYYYFDLIEARLPEIAQTAWFKRAKKKSKTLTGIIPKGMNHKVARTEVLKETDDCYCMEVLGPNGEHDRHNFAVVAANGSSVGKNSGGVFVSNCKFGDLFLFNDVHPDTGVINVYPMPVNEVEREEGFDPQNPLAMRFRWVTQGNQLLESWQVSHFRLLKNDAFLPYGSSILESARRIWRQLILIEDAMLVYRIVRSPERRVFYIDVGAVETHEIPNVMEAAVSTLRRSSVIDKQTGRIDLRYNPLSVDEDYFLPTRAGNSATKVETLAGGSHVSDIADVEYIQKKLFAALKVPRAYLGYDESLCLTGDTRIPLLDGRVLTLSELTKLFVGGSKDDLWTYSVDETTGKFVPGRIAAATLTKNVNELYVVTLDDGTVIRCTGNHPFMLRNGTYIRADELQPEASLKAMYRKLSSKVDGDLIEGYDMLCADDKWHYTHKLVNELDCKGIHSVGRSRVLHHVDCDKLNNNPSNLLEMTWTDHRKWHSENIKTTLFRPDVIKKREPIRVAALKLAGHRKKKSVQMTAQHADKTSALYKYVNSPRISEVASIEMKRRWANDDYRKLKLKQCRDMWDNPIIREKLSGDNHWCRRKNAQFDIEWLIKFCKENDVTTINQFRSDHTRSVLHLVDFSTRYVNALLKRNGFKNWCDFASKHITQNHSVISVEHVILDTQEPVYDLTIEGLHGVNSPNFVIHAGGRSGIVVHNSSKATLSQEDIRFSRAINHIQNVIISELEKLCIIHLFSHGYEGSDLTDFSLYLSNPSTIAQMQKLELWRSKFEIAGTVPENLVDRNFLRKKIFQLSDDEIEKIRAGLKTDRIQDMELESVAPASESGDLGGGGSGGLGGLGAGLGGDLGGGDIGGDIDEPGDLGGASPGGDSLGDEGGGDDKEDLFASIGSREKKGKSLLTSIDDSGEDDASGLEDIQNNVEDDSLSRALAAIKKDASNDRSGPVKTSALTKAKYNRGREKHHGPVALAMPDLKNSVMPDNDPYDKRFFAQSPFREDHNIKRPMLTNEMSVMLENLKATVNKIKNRADLSHELNDILLEQAAHQFDNDDDLNIVLPDDNDEEEELILDLSEDKSISRLELEEDNSPAIDVKHNDMTLSDLVIDSDEENDQ